MTTNLINGKIYIGQHQAIVFDPKYLGSGKYLKRAIKKYGKENFVSKMICKCYKIYRLHSQEIFYIKKYNSTNINIGYNLSTGGEASAKGRKDSEETRLKISKAKKGIVFSKEWCENISKGNKGKKKSKQHCINMGKAKKGKKYALGCHRSKENIEKMRELHKGNQYRLGFVHTKETKLKMRNSALGRKMSIEARKNMSIGKKKSIFTKMQIDRLAEYNKGRPVSDKAKEKLRIATTNYWERIHSGKEIRRGLK